MMGSSATMLSGLARRLLPRSAIRAIKVPSSVVLAAVIRASSKVFQATPQLGPPAKQPRPKLRALNRRSHSAPKEAWPSSVNTAADRALSTGYTMKSASSAPQRTTTADTNRSPRKKPRRASPKAASTASAASTTAAPQPMPNWRTASSPSAVFRLSKAQPRAPMAKPLASRPSAPSAPPQNIQAPCVRPGTIAAPTAHSARPSTPTSSHGRP